MTTQSRSRSRWTPLDDERLVKGCDGGLSKYALAERLGRSSGAVKARIGFLLSNRILVTYEDGRQVRLTFKFVDCEAPE